MTIRSLIILCLITIGSFLFFCSEKDREFKVMSFNIRYDNPADGINSWTNRQTIAYEFIHEQEPDIIGFQEVLKHQLDQLQSELSDYHFVGAGREDGKEKGEFVPVFYLKEKYELLASSHFWLSETPEVAGSKSWGAVLPRIVTWLQLKDRQNGYIFYVFNTHFSHVSAYARNESAILLINKIKTIAGEAPVVQTGDFNAEPDERMYSTITDNWKNYYQLWDSRLLPVNKKEQKLQTFNGFNPNTPELIIDHIFVNGFFNVNSFTTHRIIKDGVYISDHYPISAKLTFRLNRRLPEGNVKKLMQSALYPIIEFDQLCFFDSTTVNIKPQGQNASIYYSLDGLQPDSSSILYRKPFTIKETTTIMARAFVKNMYPSQVTVQTLIKRKPPKAQLIEVIPEADKKYYSENYTSLSDSQQGSLDELSNGSWCGFNGTDNDFLFDFKTPSEVEEVHVSCLSHPAMWIIGPSKIEVKASNDGIHYQLIASTELQPAFDESSHQRQVIHLPASTKARYVKVSVFNGGLLPDSHSGRGNPSWTFIDELVVQ